MRRLLTRFLAVIGALAIVTVVGGAFAGMSMLRRGLSARAAPSRLEEFVALRARSLATPANVRDRKNPLAINQDVMAGGRHHFADHCAQCHANDGSGKTEMGQNLYPKSPDMRGARTQGLTDGELYSTIENGIRLSGMPAWGEEHGNGEETWALVAFIRHLPEVGPDELREMKKMNPKGPGEQSEEDQEKQFLEGADEGTAVEPAMKGVNGMKGMKHNGQ